MEFKLIHLGDGKQIAVPLHTEPRQIGWYWDNITNQPWEVTEALLGTLDYSETHYPDSVSSRIVASNFFINKVLPMWSERETYKQFTIKELREAFEMGQTHQSRFENNLPTDGSSFGDFLELIKPKTIRFESTLVGQCNCMCHKSGYTVMHVMACCHPRSVIVTSLDSNEQLWANKL